MYRIFLVSLALFLVNIAVVAQTNSEVENGEGLPFEIEVDTLHPKRDMRAVFLTTVKNIDWPKNRLSSAEKQIEELLLMFEKFEDANINSIVFQVRPTADAFYKSKYEPWSYYLTGEQGKEPGYDPLQLIIDEGHKRGWEVHAWLNPYRTIFSDGEYPLSANHVENVHPEWIMEYTSGESAGKHIMNPGIPDVRSYIGDVVEDIVSNYDVDGIHFDDYFYLYGGTPEELDQIEFEQFNPDNLDREDWRRENNNQMIAEVHKRIQTVNSAQDKNVIFGVSPFGIWKSGIPSGISGTSGYSSPLYADAINWLENGTIDYVAPQLYWLIGGEQDYYKLVDWWNEKAAENGRYQMPAMALYRLLQGWSAGQIEKQIKRNRASWNSSTLGQLFFPATDLVNNTSRIRTILSQDLFKTPSVSPSYFWKEQNKPNVPQDLTYSGGSLSWSAPSVAVDGDTARRYLIYKFNSLEELITDRNNGRRTVAITGKTDAVVSDSWLSYGENYFVVSSIDKNNNESEFSNVQIVESRPVYCEAKGLNSSSEWINSVSVHNTENNSGNNDGYADFTDKIFTMQIGAETEVKLTPGFSGSALNQHWKVFIDFNNDGDFLDYGEIVISTGSSTSTTYLDLVSISSKYTEGVYRMRVMMSGNDKNDIKACDDIQNGEVEDYLVNLVYGELSIEDAGKELDGIILSNPFNDELNFNLVSESDGRLDLFVYNFTGQVVYSETMAKVKGENNFTINSSKWADGVYLMLISDEYNRKSVYKLLKN